MAFLLLLIPVIPNAFVIAPQLQFPERFEVIWYMKYLQLRGRSFGKGMDLIGPFKNQKRLEIYCIQWGIAVKKQQPRQWYPWFGILMTLLSHSEIQGDPKTCESTGWLWSWCSLSLSYFKGVVMSP